MKLPTLRGRLKRDVPLKNLNWWGVGGEAALFADPAGVDDVVTLVKWARDSQLELHTIGGGANVLIDDGGLPGLTISFRKSMARFRVEKDEIIADAGCSLQRLAVEARRAAVGGLSFYAGIPGTVGGAVFMNAGTKEGETGQKLNRVSYIDVLGEHVTVQRSEMGCAHRFTRFHQNFGVIVEAVFDAKTRSTEEAESEIQRQIRQRRAHAIPFDQRTAGSVFCRVEGFDDRRRSAGWWIEQAGFKGKAVGGARVSDRHANVIVSDERATANDIRKLISEIQGCVEEKFGIRLRREVRYLPEESLPPW